MSDWRPIGFEGFLERHAPDFGRIAWASRGEWSAGDVRGEAWPFAFDMGAKLGRRLDLGSEDDARLLLSWLYNHCVRYGETVVRHAVRLDHADGDDDEGPHWLMGRLSADEGDHPQSLLEALEEARPEPDNPGAYHSRAAAWLHLLRRFDWRMDDCASYLLISPSWCHECHRRARREAGIQWPLPDMPATSAHEDALRPWRTFKIPPVTPGTDPRQLPLEYWSRPAQPASGQQWLL